MDGITWNCFADRDAIRTLKEDGYEIKMKSERFRDIEKARPGTNQSTISFTDSNCIPDEEASDELEPWLIVSFFEIYPRLRKIYNED